MIVDVPTADDFNASGTDLLNIAWGMVVDLSMSLSTQQELWSSDADLIATDDYWNAAQRPLATALSLVQQGTEFLLKGHIASVSPYLLLSKEPGMWSKFSSSKAQKTADSDGRSTDQKNEVRFSEFKTIEAQDLIKAYNTVKSQPLSKEFENRYEDLRSDRNTIMHTVDPSLRITPKDILIDILEICHHLIGSKSWMKLRKSFIEKSPSSLLAGSEIETIFSDLFKEIDHVINLLQPAEANKYFGFNKASRRYVCPDCYREVADSFPDDIMPKLAQLAPNEPTSTSVYCFFCEHHINVSREDCRQEECQGNVISVEHHRLCLTCVRYQDS